MGGRKYFSFHRRRTCSVQAAGLSIERFSRFAVLIIFSVILGDDDEWWVCVYFNIILHTRSEESQMNF